jgi:hypothetical protein
MFLIDEIIIGATGLFGLIAAIITGIISAITALLFAYN